MSNKRTFDKTMSGFDDLEVDSLKVQSAAVVKGTLSAFDLRTNGSPNFQYSTGSWFPVLTNRMPSTNAVFINDAATLGTFVKIGRQVTVTAFIKANMDYRTPGVVDYGFGGLPFVNIGRSNFHGFVMNMPGFTSNFVCLDIGNNETAGALKTVNNEQIQKISGPNAVFTGIELFFTMTYVTN